MLAVYKVAKIVGALFETNSRKKVFHRQIMELLKLNSILHLLLILFAFFSFHTPFYTLTRRNQILKPLILTPFGILFCPSDLSQSLTSSLPVSPSGPSFVPDPGPEG